MYQYNHLKKEFYILNYKPVSSVFLNSLIPKEETF